MLFDDQIKLLHRKIVDPNFIIPPFSSVDASLQEESSDGFRLGGAWLLAIVFATVATFFFFPKKVMDDLVGSFKTRKTTKRTKKTTRNDNQQPGSNPPGPAQDVVQPPQSVRKSFESLELCMDRVESVLRLIRQLLTGKYPSDARSRLIAARSLFYETEYQLIVAKSQLIAAGNIEAANQLNAAHVPLTVAGTMLKVAADYPLAVQLIRTEKYVIATRNHLIEARNQLNAAKYQPIPARSAN
ncbi:unnamed protein product [Bursaphelenchus okinawaensis]|uniref:Uncharacterized protein n=1 Tax=Bursaphelenchus okinawaensis TaxID=465554 RepID=A0A811JQM6_9BILA|nr:unnamed protein product [Bursaphelenchus okinawaensis]CAG9078090.1 unnamed protein product [Bursaphelenchus okinawaensis]